MTRYWSRCGILRLLLRHHGPAFHDRVVNLVKGNAPLQRIAPAKELEAGAFRPKPLEDRPIIQLMLGRPESR